MILLRALSLLSCASFGTILTRWTCYYVDGVIGVDGKYEVLKYIRGLSLFYAVTQFSTQ